MNPESPPIFLLDENIQGQVLAALRRHQINATSIDELRLKGLDDEAVWPMALRSGRVIVTKDADFLEIARGAAFHPGIVFIDGELAVRSIIRAVRFIHEASTSKQMANTIEFAANYQS